MAGLTTSAIFVALENVGAAELNAIISGASLTHDCIDTLTNVGFDLTGYYLTSVGSTNLRKVSGQQIVDGVATTPGFITGRTLKTPLAANDLAIIYDVAGAANKNAVVSDFSKLAIGFKTAPGSVVAGSYVAGPTVIAAAWNLANNVTGNQLSIDLTLPVAGPHVAFLIIVTLAGAVGATTDPDIALIRDDFANIYQQMAFARIDTTAARNSQYAFLALDGGGLTGNHTYWVKMQQTAGTAQTVTSIRALALAFT